MQLAGDASGSSAHDRAERAQIIPGAHRHHSTYNALPYIVNSTPFR